jgi:heterodisulfide reductase subunit A-like polyferredoxin
MDLDPKVPSGPIDQKWEKRRFEMKLVNPANKRKHDIIVVGTGLAGASAAASLAELGYTSSVSPSMRVLGGPTALQRKEGSTQPRTIRMMETVSTGFSARPSREGTIAPGKQMSTGWRSSVFES